MEGTSLSRKRQFTGRQYQRVIAMAFSEYKLLREQESNVQGKFSSCSLCEQPRRPSGPVHIWLVVLLLTSLFFNATWIYQQLYIVSEDMEEYPSLYGKDVTPFSTPQLMMLKAIYSRTLEEHDGQNHSRNSLHQRKPDH